MYCRLFFVPVIEIYRKYILLFFSILIQEFKSEFKFCYMLSHACFRIFVYLIAHFINLLFIFAYKFNLFFIRLILTSFLFVALHCRCSFSCLNLFSIFVIVSPFRHVLLIFIRSLRNCKNYNKNNAFMEVWAKH
jgi:hypothetical protein